ncbi:MAG: glycine zipper family protein [Myxococcota bacterium]
MTLFLDIVFSFPTLLFTLALCLASLYWMMVILGALDIEALEVGDGLLDGALDGIDGAIEGLDGALDVADSAIEGALDGATEAVDGAADGAAESGIGLLTPLLFLANVFRVGRVPVTVSLTAFSLWGWVMGFVLTWLYQGAPGLVPHFVFGILSMIAVCVLSAGLTNVSVRPLEPLFKLHKARERKTLLGEVCEITTGRVDAEFGQATVQLGGDDLLFQVRCDKPNPLRKGDPALIVSFDRAREAYVIEPMSAIAQDVGERVPTSRLTNPALVNKEA